MNAERTALAVVAEHEPLLRLDLADTLANTGSDVLKAGTLHHLSSRSDVALLVTDVRMAGGMDGYALAREAAARWPRTRISVCSGYHKPRPGQTPDGARLFEKPYSAELLARLSYDTDVEV